MNTNPQCKAKAKRTGEQCRLHAEPGYKVCRLHGGKTPRGIASPHYKHGKFSRYAVPGRLIMRYNEGIEDPELLNLSSEIALTDARTNELLSHLDTGESGAAWRVVKDAFDLLAADDKSGLSLLAAAIDQGIQEYRVWAELQSMIEQRRKLVESEQKRRVAIEQVITVDEVMGLVGALNAILLRNIPDKGILGRISREMQLLLTRGEPKEVEANTDQ